MAVHPAEFVGGPLMIAILAMLFRAFLTPKLVEAARRQTERGLPGIMEGHAAMDTSVRGGSLWSRLASPDGRTAESHYFVMNWASVWRDVALGLLVAVVWGLAFVATTQSLRGTFSSSSGGSP
jgi:hypothetical protein